MSAITYAIMVICNKRAPGIQGLENAVAQLFASFLTVAVFTARKVGFVLYIAPGDWVWIIILGLLNTGLGCYLYFSSIGGLPVQTVAICGYIEPLAAVALSAVFLKEVLLPLQMVGAGLMIGGAVLGECAPRSAR